MGVLHKIKSALRLSDDKVSTSKDTGAGDASSSATLAPTAAGADAAPAPAPAPSSVPEQPSSTTEPVVADLGDKPVFDPAKVTVIFVLGGPGAGKGTQCAQLVNDYGFVHLSAGDLLRAEQNRPDSAHGALIKEYIKEGKIVPMEVTITLLKNTIAKALEDARVANVENAEAQGTVAKSEGAAAKWGDGRGRFLVDGFPRKMDQAIKFDESVCPSSFVLFLRCTEEVMLGRLLERGKTSGRDDDNVESIKKRFKTFEETSMPVVDYYRARDKVVQVDAVQPVDEVYAHIRQAMDEMFKQKGVEA